MYKLLKKDLAVESHLLLNIPRCLRVAIARFRIGNHNLEIEQGRHLHIPQGERYCKLCLSQNNQYVEDEYHVIVICKSFSELRKLYLDDKNLSINLFSFINVMSTKDKFCLVKLSNFIFSMFKLRRYLLDTL